ncbi:MAG: hypothetical protein WC572_01430 [Candidatus Omnitrophota bacterium]
MKKSLTPVFFLAVLLVFICLDIYASNVKNVSTIDAYLLNNVDDIFHYCYAKTATIDPLAVLNPYAKLLPTLIQALILKFCFLNIIFLRFLNSVISTGTLILLYAYCRDLGFNKNESLFISFITFISPLYFLSSLSSIAEPLFCFLLTLSVILWHRRKMFWFSLVVGLCAATHQVGILYVLGVSAYFAVRKRYLLAGVSLIPVSAWVAMNSLILKHSLWFTFFYSQLIAPHHRMPENSLLAFNQVNPSLIIVFVPFLMLFLAGYFDSWKTDKYPLVNLFILPALLLVLGYNCFSIISERSLWRELRYLVPIAPFLSIVIFNGMRWLGRRIRDVRYERYFFTLLSGILVLCSLCGIFYLQKDVKVISDRVSLSQEYEIREAARWLNSYMEEHQYRNLYLLNGGDTINKYVRRIWMHLDVKNRFYCLTKDFNNNDKIELFDLTTFKFSPPGSYSGVFLHLSGDFKEAFLSDNLKLKMIKEFPGISLYFFTVSN